jgi:Tfp pilus assembly protein PilN
VKRINLLPPEQRARASRERGLLWAILILVAVVVVLGVVYFWQNRQLADKQAQLDDITAQVAAEQQKAAALQPYADLQETRTSMTTTAKGIYDSRVSWSTVLQEISLVIPDNVRLQTLAAVVPATMLPGTAAAVVPGAAAVTPDVTFAGTTYTHQDVADFMTRLGLIPQLTNIQLSSSTGGGTPTSGGTSTVSFTITASLRPFLTSAPATQLQGAQQ